MAAQPIDPSTAAILGGVGVIVLLLLARIVQYITEPTVYIEPVESLVTPAEQRFYEALDEAVDAEEESRECFARAGRGGDENVPSGADDGPAQQLRLRRLAEARLEPVGYEGIEGGEHTNHFTRRVFGQKAGRRNRS